MIIDALEKRLVEALKSVDAHGDVAPAHVHDPMTMLLRENAVRANLMRWDDGRGRYVLTGTAAGELARVVALRALWYRLEIGASWAAVRCIGNPPTPNSRNSCSSGCASPRQDRPRRFGHLNGTILIYGATGYTGTLIAKAAADQGARPVPARRNLARVNRSPSWPSA